jgi:deoxyribodipyrimidine photolyase
MRELWHAGVMHNRVRMVVASFLVKHLLIDWRCPELEQLPDKLIHQPRTTTPLELASAGIELGKTYPQADRRSQSRP